MEGDGEGPTAKRGSSTACPGASRKDKGAGHSAQNDDGQGARLRIKAAATTATSYCWLVNIASAQPQPRVFVQALGWNITRAKKRVMVAANNNPIRKIIQRYFSHCSR